MFKKIMNAILNASTETEKEYAEGLISMAYQHGKITLDGKEVKGKITYADYELLYKMVNRIR